MTTTAEVLDAAGVPALLARGPAIVIEYLARGGGATDWYRVEAGQLPALYTLLRPGSKVDFYVDGCMRPVAYTPAIGAELCQTREGLALRPVPGTVQLHFMWIDDDEDLAELVPGELLYVGGYPEHKAAVRLIVPDADGVIRGHPH